MPIMGEFGLFPCKISAPTAPPSASPSSPSRVHWPIATKSKKAKEVPEIPTAVQLCGKRRSAEERGPGSPRPLTQVAHEGREEFSEPTECRRGGRGQQRNRALGNRLCKKQSHLLQEESRARG